MKKITSSIFIKNVMAIMICVFLNTASAQEIAFAFTKTLAPASNLDGTARTKMLVHNLKRVGIPQSMFLIRTADINEKNIGRMMFYDDEAQLLVNAGANESLISRKDRRHNEVDIQMANITLSQYIHYHQHIYFPYLYEGGDLETLKNLQVFLDQRGYQPTYVTYQAHDDYLDKLYQAYTAEGQFINLEKLQKLFAKMITDDIVEYNAKAFLLLGYIPRNVILLHETDLTAYSIIDIVDALTTKGFTFVSPEKIFSDPIANPFFISGYSAVGYMRSITGFLEPQRNNTYVISETEKQKIHAQLIANNFENLLPQKTNLKAVNP